MTEKPAVIAVGNPFDGLELLGPFVSAAAANAYMQDSKHTYSVVTLGDDRGDIPNPYEVLQWLRNLIASCYAVDSNGNRDVDAEPENSSADIFENLCAYEDQVLDALHCDLTETDEHQ